MIRWFTAGESHGQGLMIIMEGVPAALALSEEYIGVQLARRQRGYGRGGRQLIEQDWAHIVTGVRHGYTLGSPIGMTVENKDWANWTEAMAVEYIENPVPGRSQSPRHPNPPRPCRPARRHEVRLSPTCETYWNGPAPARPPRRVAAGAVAMRLLEEFGIKLHSHVISIGGVWADTARTPTTSIDWDAVEESPVRCADAEATPENDCGG